MKTGLKLILAAALILAVVPARGLAGQDGGSRGSGGCAVSSPVIKGAAAFLKEFTVGLARWEKRMTWFLVETGLQGLPAAARLLDRFGLVKVRSGDGVVEDAPSGGRGSP